MVLISICILIAIYFLITQLSSKSYTVIHSRHEKGYEIRENNSRIWTHIVDQDKYDKHINDQISKILRPKDG